MSSLLYIPRASLSNEDLESLVKLCLSEDVHRVDAHGGRKNETIGKEFSKLKDFDLFKKEFVQNADERVEPYWELNSNSVKIHALAKNARRFTHKSFSPEQLKIYFNPKQIENIPYSQATFATAGFVDNDARESLTKYPIAERQNQGQIHTKKGRIETAIFEIPSEKQVIVLDFADERMPGGLFLYGARTQEETICYNSDAYRALLDLKYNRFDGGFFIPEFGCLYIKWVQFFKQPDYRENRTIDVVAAACYDRTGEHGLYKPPETNEQIEINTKKKLETIIAAAQANTEGNGENTYLILGPIGCGAFQNRIELIAKLWAEVLSKPLNPNLNTEQRHAFDQIWFLSGTNEKLQVFEEAFNLDRVQRL